MRRAVERLFGAVGLVVRRRRRIESPVLTVCNLDGETFPFWVTNDHSASWWLKPAVRLDAEMRFLREVTRPGATVLEVGAHHGMHTMQLARWAGAGGQVHAFELNPENALTLSANVGINRLIQVHVVQAAVGNVDGYLSADGERVGAGSERVRALTLDSYCAEREIARVDVLKIDVEGFEAKVLRGATFLMRARPHLDIEVHLDDLPRYGDSPVRLLESIGLEGYEAAMMVRPDWAGVKAFAGPAELPESGVVNLFLRRRET